MKIGLIDCDSHNFPNIPLMKISSWHKAHGDIVEWYDFCEHYDKVYVGKVFSFSQDFLYHINADEIIRGGSGYCIDVVDGMEVYNSERDIQLPREIEHCYPDYSLYPELTKNKAFGFLTRGCPRGCEFCHVKSKDGVKTHKVADLEEFWHGQKEIILLDPNILAYPKWGGVLNQLIESKAMVDFNQGLDIRLMTEDKIEMLNRIRMKEVHFAWDNYDDKDKVLPKLEMYMNYNTKFKRGSHNAIVYVLCNFNSTFEQDLERVNTLRDMGFFPYVMIYNKKNVKDKRLMNLSRWVNNRFVFSKCRTFEEYVGK